jgi:hypothetical protein
MSMPAVNSLIELAVGQAEVEYGRKLVRSDIPAAALANIQVSNVPVKAPKWTAEEDRFLRATLGLLSEEDIASELGRSVIGVHLRWKRDLCLSAPSKAPSVIMANRASKALGIDGHTIAYWVDVGFIPGRIMPGKRKIRLIERVTLLRWACAPINWVYFDPKRVQDPKLKRLLQLEAQRWGDEWWSTRRAADYHGLRSQVKSLVIPHGSGRPGLSRNFTKAADAWILKARDHLGMTFIEIGRTMKVGKKFYHHKTNTSIMNRYHQLKKNRSIKS